MTRPLLSTSATPVAVDSAASFIVVDDDGASLVVSGNPYPSSMPPLDVGVEDPQVMRLSQAAIDKARL